MARAASFLRLIAAAAALAFAAAEESCPTTSHKPYCKVYAPFQAAPASAAAGTCSPQTTYLADIPNTYDRDSDGLDDRTIIQRVDFSPDQIPPGAISRFLRLLGFQLNIRSLYGIGQGLSVLAPLNSAFAELDITFPGFEAWLLGLPSCYAFNRLEYWLQLHGTPRANVTCQQVSGARYYLDTEPSFAPQEFLTFWRNVSEADRASNYYVANTCGFSFTDSISSQVISQYQAANGWLLTIDKVLKPAVNPRAVFPTQTLFDFLTLHPSKDLTIFYLLLVHTGLDVYLHNLGEFWTVFAPVNEAFYGINLSKLFDLRRLPLVRLWVLSHIINGNSYLYQGSLFESIAATQNITLLTQANTYLTFSGGQTRGCVGSLQIHLNAFNVTCEPEASTLFPWVDQELTNGIVHKITAFLRPYIPEGSSSGRRLLDIHDMSDNVHADAAAVHLPPLDVKFDDPIKQARWEQNTAHIAKRRSIVEAMYKKAGVEVTDAHAATKVDLAGVTSSLTADQIKAMAAEL